MRTYSRRGWGFLIAAIASCIPLACFVNAQSTPSPAATDPKPKFELASIKPGDPSVRGSFEYRPEAGRFTANSATLTQLITFAYDVRAYQLAGGPKWRDSAAFTIDAKAGGPTPPEPKARQLFQLMLQDLLADRFHLAVHRETRDDRIYELVMDRGGSKLVENTAPNGGIRMGSGQLRGTAAPLFLLVNQLSRVVERKVIDKTSLQSKYDFLLEWQPDSPEFGQETAATPDAPTSIFAALREGAGLQLKAATGPVDYIIIEKLEKPDDN